MISFSWTITANCILLGLWMTSSLRREDWPAYCPDINIIEHACNILGEKELGTAFLQEPEQIPIGLINILLESMPQRVTPLDCAILRCNLEIINLLKRYGGVSVQQIKELAAVVIQKWFRKRSQKKKLFSPICEKFYNLTPEVYPLGDFPDTYNKCVLPSKVPLHLRNSSVFYHECKGCFHKILCQHVCSKDLKNSIEYRSAVIIQRSWRKCVMKKRFVRMRVEVSKAFTCEDDRIDAEELWYLRLKTFYCQLENKK